MTISIFQYINMIKTSPNLAGIKFFGVHFLLFRFLFAVLVRPFIPLLSRCKIHSEISRNERNAINNIWLSTFDDMLCALHPKNVDWRVWVWIEEVWKWQYLQSQNVNRRATLVIKTSVNLSLIAAKVPLFTAISFVRFGNKLFHTDTVSASLRYLHINKYWWFKCDIS